MKLEFDWQSTPKDDLSREIEDNIAETITTWCSDKDPYQPCSDGPLKITLSHDSYKDKLSGNIQCLCGNCQKPHCLIDGTMVNGNVKISFPRAS